MREVDIGLLRAIGIASPQFGAGAGTPADPWPPSQNRRPPKYIARSAKTGLSDSTRIEKLRFTRPGNDPAQRLSRRFAPSVSGTGTGIKLNVPVAGCYLIRLYEQDLYFRADSYDEAKRCYGMLLDRFATSGAAAMGSLRIAQCEYNAGNDEEALSRYSDVVSRFPESPLVKDAERGIELALYRLGQSSDGSEVLARLVERYPTSSFAADAQFEIAMRSYKAERFAEAAEEFRRVVSQFPGYSAADRAHFLMADAYRQADSPREALLAYEQFLSFFPESEFRSTVNFRLGSMRFEEGQYLQAAVDFTGVLDAQAPQEIAAAALYNLALCKRMLGDGEDARGSLELYRERYSSKDERAADIAYQLGDIHDKAGRTDEALAEFARALEANPPAALAAEIRYRVGYCAELRSDADGAIREYRKAIASPEKDDPYRLLALARCAALYEEKGETGKALAAYRDLIANSKDEELVVAARERAAELKALSK